MFQNHGARDRTQSTGSACVSELQMKTKEPSFARREIQAENIALMQRLLSYAGSPSVSAYIR